MTYGVPEFPWHHWHKVFHQEKHNSSTMIHFGKSIALQSFLLSDQLLYNNLHLTPCCN